MFKVIKKKLILIAFKSYLNHILICAVVSEVRTFLLQSFSISKNSLKIEIS